MGLSTDTPELASFTYNHNQAHNSCRIGLFLSGMKVEDISPPECRTHSVFVYGTLLPILAVLVTIANCIIVAVFMKPQVRSHTTLILTMIAVADTLAILFPTIMYVYFYTFGKYDDHIPFNMCEWTYIMCDVLRDSFNSISVWLTVLLAYIRYRCIHTPFTARTVHSCKNILIWTVIVVVMSLLTHVPSVFLLNFIPSQTYHFGTNTTYETCTVAAYEGAYVCMYRRIHVWSEIIFGSIIPCVALFVLDVTILFMLRRASISRESLRRRTTVRRHREQQTAGKSRDYEMNTSAVRNGTNDTEELNRKTENIELERRVTAKISGKRMENGFGTSSTAKNDELERNVSSKSNGKMVENGFEAFTKVKRVHMACRDDTDKFETDALCTTNQSDRSDQHPIPTESPFRNVHSKLSKFRKILIDYKKQRSVSLCSEDSAYEKLDRESRRTSWLIIMIVTIITSHEIPMAVLLARVVATTEGPLPLNIFDCKTMYLQLWGYIAYPLIFLIYCCMSSAFREELWKTVTCSCFWRRKSENSDDKDKNSFMSPCTARRGLKRVFNARDVDDCVDEVYRNIIEVNKDLTLTTIRE